MGTYNANILPAATGLDLGSSGQQWDAYINNLVVGNSISGAGFGYVDARSYGVVTNGTDCSAELQAAINAAISGGMFCLLPPGTITIGSTINLNSGSTGAMVRGCGWNKTIVLYTGSGTALQADNSGVDVYNVDLRDFSIQSTGSGNIGLYLPKSSEFVLRDLLFGGHVGYGWTTAVDLSTSNIGTIDHIVASYGTNCFNIPNTGSLVFSNLDCFANTGSVFLVSGLISHDVICDGWFETQNYFVKFDDSLSGGAIAVDGFRIVNNDVVMNGDVANYPNQIALQITNSSNALVMQADKIVSHGNRYYLPTGYATTTNAFVLTFPGSPNASSYANVTTVDDFVYGGALTGFCSTNHSQQKVVYIRPTVYGSGRSAITAIHSGNGRSTLEKAASDGTLLVGTNSSDTGATLSVFNNAASGVTLAKVRSGASQSSSALLAFYDNSNNALYSFLPTGLYLNNGKSVFYTNTSGGIQWVTTTSATVWGLNRYDGASSLVDVPLSANFSTGNISLAKIISSYNGIATTGNGVPSILAQADLVDQSAAVGTTTIYTATAGWQYRLAWNAKVTTADGVSSTLGALTIGYTDPDGVAQTITCAAQKQDGSIATTNAGNTTTSVLLGQPLLINAKSGTNITYAFAYTSNTPGTMKYNLHLKLECLA